VSLPVSEVSDGGALPFSGKQIEMARGLNKIDENVYACAVEMFESDDFSQSIYKEYKRAATS
jgi:hypothetical protein